jgi:thiosulfate dehydrogenase [quinone] large subunit
MKEKNIAYSLIRVIIGVSMLGHGLVRIPKIVKFSEGLVSKFADSMIPEIVIAPFGYALTIAEFLIGLFLVMGLFTKKAALAGIVVMISLVLGSTLIENWSVLNSQLIHAAFFAFLIWFLPLNYYSLDRWIKK